MGWSNVIPTFRLYGINIPATGCFTTGHYVSKASFQSCDIDLKYEAGSGTPALAGSVSQSQMAPEVQIAINNDWTASITPSSECLSRVRSDFTAGRGSLISSFGNAVLHCMGIKRKIGIAEGVDLTISASADPNMCVFGVQLSVQYATDPFSISGFSQRFKVQVQASLTIRFGLSASGWAQLIRWVGTRAVSLVSRIPGMAARVVACLTVTTAVIVVGTVIGTALLVYGMAALVSNARHRGEIWGHAIAYASGYLDALIFPEVTRAGYMRSIDRYSGLPARINGYTDAIHNAMEFGYRRTRMNLLVTIGMNGVLDAEGPGGRRFVFSFGGGRFPENTRNNVLGAYVHYIRFRQRRAHTVPLWIDR